MGDRAQVKVDDVGVYLYTHWDGYRLDNIVREAIASPSGQGRWSDPEYLARIIFDHMVGDQQYSETGYGIGTSEHGDLQYPVVIVNCKERTVRFTDGSTVSFADIASVRG